MRPPKAPYVLVNRVLGALLSSPRRSARVGEHLILLHVVGRKTGRLLRFPVAYRRVADGRLLVLTNSPWRVNLRDRPDVEVTLSGVRHGARAELVEDPAAVARVYRELIEQAGHRRAGRRMGIRINVDRTPTLEELAEAVRRDGLSLVYLTLDRRT
ncbi:mycobacterial cell wall protein Rv0580c [Saccharothrix mutabilis subsp. mutabilis]|uniref:Mycobacterial cell wall protein Rv0580c n=2 Tax=Saccharothrix mutabilis TaxID=33921 RepID=A0ABN0TXI7_9PSEU